MTEVRRTDLIWEGEDEVEVYSRLVASSKRTQQAVPDYIKNLLKNVVVSIAKLFANLS